MAHSNLKFAIQALLGAMEQQEVTIAKAGLCATLPARTSVLAAANPVEGHYNRGRTLMENLKMSDAMLSRFDLVFLLLDKPDELQDQLLSDHILAMHSGVAAHTLEYMVILSDRMPCMYIVQVKVSTHPLDCGGYPAATVQE
jgi:DNA replicative helicase MCM subunit Mcm2 (Cdc46/Mcm family)